MDSICSPVEDVALIARRSSSMSTIRAAAAALVLICLFHAFAPAQTTSDNPCPPKVKDMAENYKPDFFFEVELDCAKPPFWFRVGDQIWKEVPTPVKVHDSGFLLSIPYTSADHFILIATGDCKSFRSNPSKCSPVALMVQTAVEQPKEKPDAATTKSSSPTKDDIARDAATEDDRTTADAHSPLELTPLWQQLLSWDSGAQAYKVTQDFKGFFKDKPRLRVVINGNISVVGDLPTPTPGKEPRKKPNESKNQKDQAEENAKKEALTGKIKAENRSWAGKLLDPESDLNVRIY